MASKSNRMPPPPPRPSSSKNSTVISGSFPSHVKEKMKRMSEECWSCGATKIQIAHVLGKADGATKFLEERGLINFDPLSMMNAVGLCPTCHAYYHDALDPLFFFVPSDLDFFIRFELRDRIRRQGDIAKRRVPLAHEYARYQYRQGKITDVAQGGQYTRVYLDDTPWAQSTQAPKQWHGAPLPTIRKAIGALGSPRIGRVPQDMVMKLTILRDLYYLDDEEEAERRYQLQRPSQDDDYHYQDSDEGDDDNGKEEEEEEDEDADDDDDDETEPGTKGGKRCPKWTKQEARYPKRQRQRESRFEWDLGPDATAEDAIRKFGPVLLGPGRRLK
ncbi:hypothetical protein KXV95_001668 [Aspergillus fumigatus]|nr:hypothetical protein KXX11_008751 [Aspergillus fumigatus]KMK55594.1 hypothetical protein Y699_09028 [Aspergillus fumigatus Z5]KAH1352875.1 hypothetical protein KXX14_001221 [Aspergillus fumigatus]KAH1378617.1 hypothetical protein KXX50_008420 [Aspergillus fumigatus]KAH1433237.1 hypothetical protein KXX32_001681 [Aspergillus fumigatus]